MLLRDCNHPEQSCEASSAEQDSLIHRSAHHCLFTYIPNLLIFIKGPEYLTVLQSLALCLWSIRFTEWRTKAKSAFLSQGAVPLSYGYMGWYYLIHFPKWLLCQLPGRPATPQNWCFLVSQVSLCLLPLLKLVSPVTTTCKSPHGHTVSLPAGTEEPMTGVMREASRGTVKTLTFCWSSKVIN